MFRYPRRVSPLRVVGGLAVAFVLVNAIGGAVAAGIGTLLILPILLFKMFILIMMFRLVLGFAGVGDRFARRNNPARRGHRARRPEREEHLTPEEAELREYVRKAREQLDDLYPQP